MSTKFEQLLDYLVNEEMDKANELFHEIVVEKSRDIYENLIAEEADEEDEDQDESVEESEESDEDDEQQDESVEELEDSYAMGEMDDDESEAGGLEKTDDFGADIGAMDDEEGPAEPGEDEAMMDIKNAIEELEAAFAELSAAKGEDMDSDFDADMDADADMGAEFDADSEEETDEMMSFQEGRRLTREYVEKVGNDWDKNSQKTQGQAAGADTGDKMGSPVEGKSPVSSAKGKPTTGATAKNIVSKSATADEDGTKPHGKVGGVLKQGGKFTGSGTHNVDGVKSGVKTLDKKTGYPQNNKTPGPVGSGTGDKAGQTSVGNVKSPINGAPNRNA